jgi:hypothetical protein
MARYGSSMAVALLLGSGAAGAIDRIVLEAGEISVAGTKIGHARAELDLTGTVPKVAVKAQRLELTQPRAAFDTLNVSCAEVIVKEPVFACGGGRLTVAGIPAQFAARLDAAGWAAEGRLKEFEIATLRQLVAPWAPLPAQYAVDGRLNVTAGLAGRAGALQLKLAARTNGLNFTNEAGTVVAEKMAARVNAAARQTRDGFKIEAEVASGAGQALAGPVLLDFGANPLQLTARGNFSGQQLQLDEIAISQKDLLRARAQASVQLGPTPVVTHARADIASLQFPAAYTSFLQIALAATDFGTLEATGAARGAMEIAHNRLARLDVQIDDLDLEDDKSQFAMTDLRGDLHWTPAADAPIEASSLAWAKVQAYGLRGGTARLDFRARGFGFELTREARVPIFDGTVVVHSLAARQLGGAQAELDFDAHIEPISMSLLSKAFGWPELSGQLAGRIPGLTYRNHVLALNGDLTANVFDGTITGRNFRLRDPLGPWPRLFADITARKLDLELVTHTFSIGSITGRLDADLQGLELFNWSPVAFDARLYSTPGDRSQRLISQKAVTSISSIGGGAGGVTKALQSGVLRFFEQFRYDRIGINCRLRNEVCLMTGVEPHGAGYYIVKGRGIPRIDIIGNSGRVDWPQLVTQIVQGMRSENVIVR